MFTRHTTTWAAAIALTMTTAATAGEFPDEWYWGEPAQRAQHAALEGQPMPELDLTEWRNTEALTADDLKGNILVIDFWATWCGPCIGAMPKNNQLHEKYGDQGVIIMGICGSNGQEKFDKVLEQQSVAYPNARDASQENAERWKVMWWPTYAVVDREGVVRALGLQTGRVEDALKKVLEEQPADETADAAEPDGPLMTVAEQTIDEAWLEGDADQRARLADLDPANPPALQLENWINHDEATLEELHGKVVVLDFWATWCGPCIGSIPKNNELYEAHKDDGLVVLGVCHPRGAEKMADVVAEHGIAYPTAADPDGKTIEAYHVNGFPDYYVFDRAGNLRAADVKNSKVKDVVEALLAEPAPDSATAAAE